jgi:hypothetical protein
MGTGVLQHEDGRLPRPTAIDDESAFSEPFRDEARKA